MTRGICDGKHKPSRRSGRSHKYDVYLSCEESAELLDLMIFLEGVEDGRITSGSTIRRAMLAGIEVLRIRGPGKSTETGSIK